MSYVRSLPHGIHEKGSKTSITSSSSAPRPSTTTLSDVDCKHDDAGHYRFVQHRGHKHQYINEFDGIDKYQRKQREHTAATSTITSKSSTRSAKISGTSGTTLTETPTVRTTSSITTGACRATATSSGAHTTPTSSRRTPPGQSGPPESGRAR